MPPGPRGVASGKPVISGQDQKYTLADSSKDLEGIAHMAIVDSLSPLHISLSSLESAWNNLLNIASQEDYSIPELSIPKIDVKSILSCKPKYSPKYPVVLQYISDHYVQVQDHIANAKELTEGLKFVSQLIMYKKIDHDTLASVSKMLSNYLTDYASTISSLKSVVCQDQTAPSHPMDESYMDTPLSMILKGTMPTGAGVDKGFALGGGGVGKGFNLNGGGVGKGFDLNGGGVGKGFDLNGGGVGKGFDLNGGGVGKGFDLNGGGVGKGFALGGGGVGKGFSLTGGGVGREVEIKDW
ncbi:sperm-activating peptides [Strongylocentrotus purpuratus]|uniref:Sperm-activating peptides n=1 Tax=Strongylocentrotus purpuratus TaxID=7668 RepID=SAPR_STRPU|nr:sperm-activating peptides [Strongylocentrotus purpuratus]P11761.2 RecName: Full=Sperm-activating peptides; Contains: RecName: Full=Speract; Contains: RecName: Full=Speract-like 1; Contains: RecName: Full=Speract-like 2; Contains: RecName: Full=Speract-like 3; Contains: RecName: Full=Speract-like 4; Contains: RecName: Full=Speract-like 5; Flags: Precursor [Strongylocentrotus purpuratus]AAA30079.1 speract protein [Strongylocentrotus purpuratus]|eukprot:NP_999771.1 sperm-activating peptides [Strongylocentrotus purpuratus]